MECARATGNTTVAASLSSRSLPLVVLSFLLRGPPPPPYYPGLLWCLLNRVQYVRFPSLEGLGSYCIVQHVFLLDERPIIHL